MSTRRSKLDVAERQLPNVSLGHEFAKAMQEMLGKIHGAKIMRVFTIAMLLFPAVVDWQSEWFLVS